MRNFRGTKFSEYVSTYAILKHVGLHRTALIERREAPVGYGIYARDSCDEGTVLVVVPLKQTCTTSGLAVWGPDVQFIPPDVVAAPVLSADSDERFPSRGVVSRLLGCAPQQWIEFVWRLALEHQRRHSRWWGWLSALPELKDFSALSATCDRNCRVGNTQLLPFLLPLRGQIDREVQQAYELLQRQGNLLPSKTSFQWAALVALSRGVLLPVCYSVGRPKSTPELGAIPFIDLANGVGPGRPRANASIELATSLEELPKWYIADLQDEVHRRWGADGSEGQQRLVEQLESEAYVLLTLSSPVSAAEEVVVDYGIMWQQPLLLDIGQSEDRLLQRHLSRGLNWEFIVGDRLMSLAFTRFTMRLTTYSVDKVRNFSDGCNVVIGAILTPFQRLFHRISLESPWVILAFAASGASVIPLIAYPRLKPYLVKDEREERERDRVRLCLQKGIDPYPYMRHKDYVYGNVTPAIQSEEEVPRSVAWEYTAMREFERKKEELRREVGADVDVSVQKMLELRAELRGEFEKLQKRVKQEPTDLIFYGRNDVNVLRS